MQEQAASGPDLLQRPGSLLRPVKNGDMGPVGVADRFRFEGQPQVTGWDGSKCSVARRSPDFDLSRVRK